MHSFRRYSAFLSCLALLLSLPLTVPPPSEAYFSITIYFGKARCAPGFGICRIDIGAAREAEAPKGGETSRTARKGQASATIEQDKTARDTAHLYLKIEMRTALPEKAPVVPVAENFTLDAATSKALGLKSVTVLRGEYKIDYSKNKFGSIVANVEARN